MKKNKLIDRLKSWLVTLGIASVFGLAALGVNAANSYQKASAYDYQDNGALIFEEEAFDLNILQSFVRSHGIFVNNHYVFECNPILNDENDATFTLEQISSYDSSSIEFDYDLENDFYVVYARTESGSWQVDEVSGSFTAPFSSLVFNTSTIGYQELRNYVLSYNAPQESGNFVTALTSFMSLIGGGIVQLAQSVGAGIVSFASALFIDNGSLSILGGIIAIFAGIALAVGITSKVYAWVSTLGN